MATIDKQSQNQDHDWTGWEKLSDEGKRFIYNNYWDPYAPQIGYITKAAIVHNFEKSLKFGFRQIGLRSFGWGVYMLFVIVDTPRQRVFRRFAGLSVNKGVVVDFKVQDIYKVKFDYGGTMEVDLAKTTIIG